MQLKLFIVFTLCLLGNCTRINIKKPHIVFMVADDLGWNDVSYHGSNQIKTPNIDMIAYKGIVLSQYYTDAQGTPSRSSLFTGKYAMRLGTQGISISAAEDRGVPPLETLLPSRLRDMGYVTHLVGKWNIGQSRDHYLPTNRGFDSFYGYLHGSVDYYTYNHVKNCNGTVFYGLDFFDDLNPVEDQRGHLTEVLTDRAVELIRSHNISTPLYLHMSHAAPHTGGGYVNLQTPEDHINANDHIAHSARRLYAGLVTGLDESVGIIISALAKKNMLHDTLIIFMSDNGAASAAVNRNFGSNLPLRGTKGTPWEGAVHSPAIIWHASLPSKIWHGLFHVTDWLPTLITAAGGNCNYSIDGINQWDAIMRDEKPPRTDVLIALDDLENWAAFREGDFKIIVGDVNKKTSDYYGNEMMTYRLPVFSYSSVLLNSETANVFSETLGVKLDVEMAFKKRNRSNFFLRENKNETKQICIPSKLKGCLFNVSADPIEAYDLWYSLPDIAKRMMLRLRVYWAQLKPRREPKLDYRANPAFHHFIWFPWIDNEEQVPEALQTSPSFPLRVSEGEIQYLLDINLNSFKDTFVKYFDEMAEILVKSITDFFTF